MPPWARILFGIGLALLVVAGAGVVAVQALTARYEQSVDRELLLHPAARRERVGLSGPLNYLLVGSDRRGSGSPSAHPTAETGRDQRSDTIIIAHLPRGLDQAYLVSIPRDLLVSIPAAPATGYPGGPDKINSAFQYGGGGQGGTRLLSATLTQLTGIRFDGAALIDFAGFQRVIDLLGGVRMCVQTPVRSIHTGTVFERGCQEMTGAQALDYARQRYDLPGGDYDRQRHQQQLLSAMLAKASSSRVLSNPIKVDRLIRAVGSSLTVDTNGMPLEDLVLALREMPRDALRGIQLPSHPYEADGLSYVRLDPAAGDLFLALTGSHMADWMGANPSWVHRLGD